ncbi:hypothetical protein DPMN_162027 [Dreissena polymorpha]|uniref:Uncharacterized protein n=1 Tax=Dreissena polymorpha TaxID=45954 RepID=A0A9D4ET83_DREPO|nr:hypothetical protein DPMN_162027 [Dreissena polymorpha]
MCTETRLVPTLLMTAICASPSIMENQTPMSCARSATGLRVSLTNFWASSRISTQLLRRANKGANGKAATKIVMNPNCKTATKRGVMSVRRNFDQRNLRI